MRYLLDTNAYGKLVAGDLEVNQRLDRASAVWLSLITVGELLAGFATGARREQNERRLGQALELQGVGVLLPDSETAQVYGDTFASLKSRGKKIPTNDLWIAAQALQHNLVLDSSDAHFDWVPGLRRP